MAETLGPEVTEAPSYQVLVLSGSDPALTPYRNLIFTSFLKSLRYGNSWFEDIDSTAYHQIYHQVIENLLKRADAVVRLAVLVGDEDICLGWSLAEGETLHYVYVKGDIKARRQGIGTSLLPPKFTQISHLTKLGRVIWKKKFENKKFNPFLA